MIIQKLIAIYHTKVMQTAWMPTEEQKVELKGLNLDTVWENIVIAVGGVNIEKGNSLDEQIEINEKSRSSKKRLQNLKSRQWQRSSLKRSLNYQTCASGRSSAHLQTARPDSLYWYPQPLSNPPYPHSGGVNYSIAFNSSYIVSYNFNWYISLNICLSNIMCNKCLCWIARIITYCSRTSNCCIAHYRNSLLSNRQKSQLYLFAFEL